MPLVLFGAGMTVEKKFNIPKSLYPKRYRGFQRR